MGKHACGGLLLLLILAGCGRPEAEQVVVYVSVDQPHAEPVLADFEARTGITPLAVYDIEANKTVGLANRLLAERARPRADVFWNGEFVQTLRLKREGVLERYEFPAAASRPAAYVDPDRYWTGLAPRCRVWIAPAESNLPEELSLLDLPDLALDPRRIVMARPQFGTSATHAAALYAALGRDAGRGLYRRLVDRGIRFVDGNATVRDLVVAGEADLGLTDSDDALGALRQNPAVRVWAADQGGLGTFVVPGTVAMVRGGPHPEQAAALIRYLASGEAEALLLASGFGQLPIFSHDAPPPLDLGTITPMKVTAEEVVAQLDAVTADLQPSLFGP